MVRVLEDKLILTNNAVADDNLQIFKDVGLRVIFLPQSRRNMEEAASNCTSKVIRNLAAVTIQK